MNRWRLALVAFLICVPIVAWAGVGSFTLWRSGYAFVAWWPLFGCASLGYFLAWYWLPARTIEQPTHLTDRDQEAWQLIERRSDEVAHEIGPTFRDIPHYAAVAQKLADDLARIYHPDDPDPLGAVTVLEVLAALELACQDLADNISRSVPFSDRVTIQQCRSTYDAAMRTKNLYQQGNTAWWAAAALLDPITTTLRYAASHAGLTAPIEGLQNDAIRLIHRSFVHELGRHLIELYSGRLRVGARRYRELKAEKLVHVVTLTLLGQAKVGKSSLINALLGAQQAQTDVIPCTGGVTRYELPLSGTPTRLVLLDTVGYGQAGPQEDQLKATQEAAQQSDLLILVLHARNPARQADREMLQRLEAWFAARPDLRRPPVLAALTHIDLLSPAMEWSPPYNWQVPERLKEQQMSEALAALRDQLGDQLDGAVPVCTAADKVYGIDDGLLPLIIQRLGEARAVALLRCLHGQQDAGKIRRLLDQTLTLGERLLDAYRHRKQGMD